LRESGAPLGLGSSTSTGANPCAGGTPGVLAARPWVYGRRMDVRGRRAERFAVGTGANVEELEGDPHALFARLRDPARVVAAGVGGVACATARVALQVMRDARTFTVEDHRFSTGQVVGPSMLTRDGAEHRRPRDPFARPLHPAPGGSHRARTAAAPPAHTPPRPGQPDRAAGTLFRKPPELRVLWTSQTAHRPRTTLVSPRH
jgi:cytochrome P450